MPAVPGDQVVYLGRDRPELPLGSVVRVIATDEHPLVPRGYLLVIDDNFKAFRINQYRGPQGEIWLSDHREYEGPADIPEELFLPGDIASLVIPLTINKVGTFPDGTLLTVDSSNPDWTRVVIPRMGKHTVPTESLVRVQTALERPGALPPKTRWDFIDDED